MGPKDTQTDGNSLNSIPRMSTDCVSLTSINFNCKGASQSVDYILKLLSECDILCLSETWLRPEELHIFDSLVNCNNAYSVFSKSSMHDLEGDYSGRPFGGLSVICKKQPGLLFHEVNTNCDRIQVIKVCDHQGNCVQKIFNVYMPYFDGTRCLTEEFIRTIDQLQSLIDNITDTAPLKLLGDFNVQLPSGPSIPKNWQRRPGFNTHSVLLYDFLLANDLLSGDLCHTQPSKYTFFCHKRAAYTWIDHVFVNRYDMPNVTKCCILPLSPDNVSDHLPIKCTFNVYTCADGLVSGKQCEMSSSKANWSNAHRNAEYSRLLQEKLVIIDVSLDDRSNAEAYVNSSFSSLCDAIHSATKEAGIIPSRSFKPKPYWCPNLSILRDRKSFWWRIWISNNRPRNGVIFDCYKGIKKVFRRECRRCLTNMSHRRTSLINRLFNNRNMVGFWSQLKLKKSRSNASSIDANGFASYYSNIMQDDKAGLTHEQQHIEQVTSSFFQTNCTSFYNQNVDVNDVKSFVKKLKKQSCPGLDGITAEHLTCAGINDNDALYVLLARLASLILSYNIVPNLFHESVIVPVLKKPTLDPNITSNYRPITISSVFAKLLELMMVPEQDGKISDTQFGFRKGRDTLGACSFLNDILCYFNDQGSPVYVCSLDAEKCFDKIWHAGLFYKLMSVIPVHHWLLLYRWYKCSYVKVKWQGCYSNQFHVSRGTKQGSVLSPILFNFFINDLLLELNSKRNGACIDTSCFNNFAYADDITLLSTNATSLQDLIDTCFNYSEKWRFVFGAAKTKCMVAGNPILKYSPSFYLNDCCIATVDCLDVLGVKFNSSVNSNDHILQRIRTCQRSMFSVQELGMTYPGLSTEVKAYIWNTMCLPTLTYGCAALNVSNYNVDALSSCQGKCIKRSLGLSNRAHHSNLVAAAGVLPVKDVLRNCSLSLYNRQFISESPAKLLNSILLSKYICNGLIVEGTLLGKVICQGLSPVRAMFQKPKKISSHCAHDNGVIDSLRYLIHSENYVQPQSNDHVLVRLLTRAF